jgi:hypothetical protein
MDPSSALSHPLGALLHFEAQERHTYDHEFLAVLRWRGTGHTHADGQE